MSQIATFKLVLTGKLDAIKSLIEEDPEKAQELCEEIDNDDDLDLSNSNCSGDVFSAIYDYLEAEHALDFMENSEYLELLEFWQETTGPLDVLIFTQDVAGDILAVIEDTDIEEDGFTEYMDADWEINADHAMAGLKALRKNLQRVDTKHALLYFLY